MKTIIPLLTASLLGAALSMTGVHAQEEPPAGGEQDVRFAERLWQSMEDAHLVGADPLNTQPYEGVEPHGRWLQTLAMPLEVDGRTARVIVKRNFAPTERAAIWRDPTESLAAVTVMFEREEGYDAENGNWFWAKYAPDGQLDRNPEGVQLAGRVGKGAEQGCIACHAAAGGGDYQFVNDD